MLIPNGSENIPNPRLARVCRKSPTGLPGSPSTSTRRHFLSAFVFSSSRKIYLYNAIVSKRRMTRRLCIVRSSYLPTENGLPVSDEVLVQVSAYGAHLFINSKLLAIPDRTSSARAFTRRAPAIIPEIALSSCQSSKFH